MSNVNNYTTNSGSNTENFKSDDDLIKLEKTFTAIHQRYTSEWKRQKRLSDSAICHRLTKSEIKKIFKLWLVEQSALLASETVGGESDA